MAAATAKLGVVFSRVVVPAWVLAGALFKLAEGSPRLLPPKTVLTLADRAGIDLYFLLATLIGLEFLAVAVMVTLSRFARAMAVFVLSVFAVILLGEIVQGNFQNCGCLGAHSPPPWLMLLIDGSLLAAVLLFDPSPLYPAVPPRWPAALTVALAAAGFIGAYGVVLPQGRAVAVDGGGGTTDGGDGGAVTDDDGPATADPAVNPDPEPPPGYWFTSDVGSWEGRPWKQVELFQFMKRWPEGLDEGTRYVVFYGRTCDHCEDMFNYDLTDPQLARQVTAVQVPDGKNRLTGENAWFMPQTEVEHLELPLGCDWIITTPLTLRIEDGIVTCAEEGGHRRCMDLE